MADGICDVCEWRPATHITTVVRDGRTITIELCGIDYARFKRAGAVASPFESLFTRDGFTDPFSRFPGTLPGGPSTGRDREAVNVSDYLSEHTQELVQRAAQVAAEFGRSEVDTEHLLHAIAGSEVVTEILRQFKLQPVEIRNYIEANAPKDAPPLPEEPIRLSVSPRVKSVFETAFRVSRELGHSYIGPEHLLVALAAEEEGLAGEILRRYGLSPEAIRQQVVKVVGQGAQSGRVESKTATPQLDAYSRDLTVLAKQGRLDPVIGRAKEIETTIEILARRTKNNPALIGEPGVGKTSIVEGLAQRILSGNIPQALQNKRVVELNLNSMIAGSKYRGEFEERIKTVLDEIVSHQDELIVFVDELHTIVGAGAGGGEGGLDVSNVIKPSLARGELHLIGATTLNEYQKYIEKDAALERRFQPVFVPEPTVEQTIEILRGLRDRYEAHHKVKITDEAIVAAAELSDRYVTGRFMPDKAIDLIDQAAARVRIGADTHSAEIATLNDQIARLHREQESATSHKQYDRARHLTDEIASLTSRHESLESRWRKQRGATSQEVLVEHVADIVSNITGIPVTELTQEERNRLLQMEDRLHERVVGQDEAIRAVSDAIRLSRAGLAVANRPIAAFLFLGPTGVGKTELAKALAWIVFGDESALTRIDMSEYMERHSVARLIGAPPGYVGYEEGGQLTERVRRRPYSVLLLDELEKAHPDVSNILLQVFDEGRLTDGKGRLVDFTNAIIIATSNLGSDLIQKNLTAHVEDQLSYGELRERLMDVLRANFRPEFLNRLDEVIVFQPLTREQLAGIVQIQLERVKHTARGQNIDLDFDQSVIDHLAQAGYQPEFGARQLRRRLRTEIENKLAGEILKGAITAGSRVTVRYSDDAGVTFDITPAGKLQRKEAS